MRDLNGNIIKLFAALFMLLDHAGLLLFPDIPVFRYLGRLAMPLYAFLISEGALHTRNKLKYFLEIFLMGAACQSVYIAEELITYGIRSIYLNILITFSFSLLIIFPFIKFKEYYQKKVNKKAYLYFTLFILSLSFAVFFEALSKNSLNLLNISLKTDYGIMGILLPLGASLFKEKNRRILCFTLFLVLFNLYLMPTMPYTWFSLLTIPFIVLYNGKRGKKKYKYAFYLFYPLHLAVLYLIAAII